MCLVPRVLTSRWITVAVLTSSDMEAKEEP